MEIRATFNLAKVLYLIIIWLAAFLIHGPVMVRAQSGNQTRLQIVVPPKSGFKQFVNISFDPTTGNRTFNGFAIEVFRKAVDAIVDNSIEYDFVVFEKSDGTMNGSYDDMLRAVNDKVYDGAVGDITIRATRTKWVDFTVAYTDIQVSMLIPGSQTTKNKTPKSLIISSRRMVIGTLIILLVSIIVFLASDITKLVLSRNNGTNAIEERNQVWKREMLGTIKGTRLTTLLLFVILVFLITYYATSLNWLLSRKQPELPNKSINRIIRTGENVGYYQGSFVYDLLRDYGVFETQLFPYTSEEQLLEMFNESASDGGISVAIDETLPLSVFMANHCNKYTLFPLPSFQAYGYGFAFRNDTNLVQKISKGIIDLIDGGDIRDMKANLTKGTGACIANPSVNVIPNIVSPHILRTFKACAIICMFLLVIIYTVYIVTTDKRCLRYLFR